MAWWEFWRGWGGRPFSLSDPNNPFTQLVEGDEHVSYHGASNVSAWYAAIRLYQDVVGTLPLKFYQRAANDDRLPAPDHPVARIITDPNPDNTTQEFWGSQAAGLIALGNGYAEKLFIGDRLVGLDLLPLNTIPYRDGNYNLFYRYTDWRGVAHELPAAKVFHTRANYEYGDLGVSSLSAARKSLALSMATERSARELFSRGMRARGFFTTGGAVLTQEQRDQANKNLIERFSGQNGKDWGILEGNFDVKVVSIQPKDAEMLLSRRFNVEDIARFVRVPPILLGHSADGQTMWGTGIENIILAWRTLGLDALLSTIEKSINKRLLSPADRLTYYAEFDRDGLMQADSKARAEAMQYAIGSAQMTPNEGRKKNNRPPLPGGDKLFINSTYVPIDQAGQKAAPTAPGKEPPAPPPKETP